jgi:hypothetical protein
MREGSWSRQLPVARQAGLATGADSAARRTCRRCARALMRAARGRWRAGAGADRPWQAGVGGRRADGSARARTDLGALGARPLADGCAGARGRLRGRSRGDGGARADSGADSGKSAQTEPNDASSTKARAPHLDDSNRLNLQPHSEVYPDPAKPHAKRNPPPAFLAHRDDPTWVTWSCQRARRLTHSI